jgi:hypothetical protein
MGAMVFSVMHTVLVPDYGKSKYSDTCHWNLESLLRYYRSRFILSGKEFNSVIQLRDDVAVHEAVDARLISHIHAKLWPTAEQQIRKPRLA